MRIQRLSFQRLALGLAALLMVVGPLLLRTASVSGAEFSTRELKMSNPLVNATAEYRLAFSGQSAGTVGSIRLQLCTNDPFPGNSCTAPAGLNFGSAALVAQGGMTGFSVSPGTTANELILTRVPGASVAGMVSYQLSGVHNPSNSGTVFGRLETFASTDSTGARHDAAGLAVAYMSDTLNVQTYVPPYLLFCIASTIQPYDCSTAQGNYIDFGDFSITKTATGQTQILVATNADFGYTIRVTGTTLTSGVNTIAPLSAPDTSRKGVSQFGLNLRANTTPPTGRDVQGTGIGVIAADYNTPDFYKFTPGDVLVSANDPDNFRLFTVSYVVNVNANQEPGVYVSTLTYIALASF